MGFPTIIAERKGKSSSGKMKSLVALTLVLAVAAGDMMLKKKIHHDMMVDASQAMCWGQGNMFYWKLAMMNAVEECHTGQHQAGQPLRSTEQTPESFPDPPCPRPTEGRPQESFPKRKRVPQEANRQP